MLILKVSLLSCAFYLGFVLTVELVFFEVTLWKDGVGLFFTWWGWAAWSGAFWLLSTTLPHHRERDSHQHFEVNR